MFGVDAPDVNVMRWVPFGSSSTGLWKAVALSQQTQTLCENRLICNYWFLEHLRQCCTQNSERLLSVTEAGR